MSRENVKVVRELYRAWNDGDPGWKYYTPDLEWDVSRWAPDLPGIARGQDEVRGQFRRFLEMWSEVHFEPEQFIDHGDRVVVTVTVQTRGRAGGVPVVERLAHVFTLRDGFVARFVLYPTAEEALEAVGLSE
jgi:uncharacterized protein